MRQFIFYIAILLLCQFNGYSQCFPDRHGTAWYEGWISCEKSLNPNSTERPESHWIMYDFGVPMEMYNLTIWNINAPDYLSYGIQLAHVDYSEDGVTWEKFGDIALNPGTGKNTYEGEQLLNFDGKKAQYLLITAITSHGSDCAGFAELRLEVDSVEEDVVIVDPPDPVPTDTIIVIVDPEPEPVVVMDSICIIADVFPNPVSGNELFVTLKQQCVPSVYYTLTDVSGRVVVPSSPIMLEETIDILNGTSLPAGVYILELTSNYAKSEYKVIKQ